MLTASKAVSSKNVRSKMPNNPHRDAGFGVAGVIIVLSLLVAGLIGWRVYDANRPQQSATTTPAQTGNEVEPAPELVDPNEGYVVIEQWDVRFKPVESLGEVQYFKPKDLSLDAFTFTTKALADASSSCAPSSENIIQGLLYRNKEQQPASGEVLANIGGYYYQFRGPDSTCGAGNDQLEVDSLMQLKQSLRTLEVAQ
jgi:hypothetical protein